MDEKSKAAPSISADLAADRTSISSNEGEAASSTILNVYRDKHNVLLTPCINPKKEKYFPSWKKIDKFDVASNIEIRSPQSYFLQQPILSFHEPPFLLRHGHQKSSLSTSAPVCLIHNSLFWKKWKIQIGPSLAQEGVIDPRGVVSEKHNGNYKTDETALRGYKVRSWRMWGESGKKYHNRVNELQKKAQGETKNSKDEEKVDLETTPAVQSDEVLYLHWSNPLSTNTRRYSFTWHGISFYWKGTGTVRENRRFGSWVRYAHLKLIVELPAQDTKEAPPIETCLAKYTCSIVPEKAGILQLYDQIIGRLVEEHMQEVEIESARDTIIATALCMILGEFEKRLVLKEVILALVSAGEAA